MKKWKKALALGLAVSMTLSLAACGNKPAAPSAAPSVAPSVAPTTAATPAPSTNAAPVEITWWAFPNFGVDSGYEQQVADAFMAANSDVTVKVETLDFTSGPDKLTAAISAKTAPDVLFDAPGRIIEYGNGGYLANLDDMIGTLKSDLTNPNLLQTCIGADGSHYMYPLSSSPFYMGLNKEALEAADALQYVNLEGDRTWTTDNFVKMCEALAAAKVTTVPGIVYCGSQGGDQGTRALVANLCGSAGYVSADGKWAIDAKGVESLKLLQDMYNKGSIDAGFDMAAADELQKFQQETCAMTICWGTGNAKSYATDDFTQISVPFPAPDGKPNMEYLVNGFCVFNNGDQAKIDASKRLVAFISDDTTWGPKSVTQTGAFPVRTSFGDLYAGNEEMGLLASWSQYYGPYYNTRANFATMRGEWWNMLQRVFQGGDVQAEVDVFNTNANTVAAK